MEGWAPLSATWEVHRADLCLRDAIRSGLTLGPRMLARAAGLVCMTGGHGWQFGREADALMKPESG